MFIKLITALLFSIFYIFNASATDVTINCLLQEDQSVWSKITDKFITCDLQDDLQHDAVAIEALGESATIDPATVQVFVVANKKMPLIPDKLLTVFPAIVGISIDSTNLAYLDENILKVLTTLKYFSATNNAISVIAKGTFELNVNLILLDLTGNPVHFVDESAFTALTALEFLTLTNLTCLGVDAVSTDATTAADITALKALTATKCGIFDIIHSSLASIMRGLIDTVVTDFCEPVVNNGTAADCETEVQEWKDRYDDQIIATETCKNETADLNSKIFNLTNKITELENANSCNDADGTCKFKVMTDNFGYSCVACGISVQTEKEQVVKWNGSHVGENSNDDVMSLIIESQSLVIFPSNVGNSFRNLENLVVKSCGLKSVKRNDFKSLTWLKTIDFSKNDIAELPSKIFDGLSNLKVVNLSDNKLKKIRFDWVASGNTIAEFYLNNNPLGNDIEQSFIWRMQKAQIINLSETGCEYSLDKQADPGQKFMEFYINIIKFCNGS